MTIEELEVAHNDACATYAEARDAYYKTLTAYEQALAVYYETGNAYYDAYYNASAANEEVKGSG